MKRIYMDELLFELKYKDVRGVRAWCSKNNILLMKNGKAEFVFESEFKEIIERPFINKLKIEFGEDWESVYKLYTDGNIVALNTLQALPNTSLKTYKPKEPMAKSYQNQFSEYAKS